jgi:hypothetical protein
MHDAADAGRARALLGSAARRLAASCTASGAADPPPADIQALRHAVAAYLATYHGVRERGALTHVVLVRVREALWSDEGATFSPEALACVLDVAREAVKSAVVRGGP